MKFLPIILIILILASFGVAIYFNSFSSALPDKLASHWDSQGQVNGYMSKFLGLFLMPIIILAITLLFYFLPKIDPRKESYNSFRKYYDAFILFLVLFMLYVYILTILWNLGMLFNMSYTLLPALALLFYYVGMLVSKSKRNWFVGIRTPWTLSSDYVWDKTHKLGGILFRIAAVFILLGLVFPTKSLYFILIPIITVAIITFVYSYFVFRKESK